MNMWISVEAHFPQAVADREAVAARLIALWNHHVDGEHQIDQDSKTVGSADPTFTDLHLDGECASIEYPGKWETEGIADFARAASLAYPEATIHTLEEWTGEDPNIVRQQWEGGAVVAEKDSAGLLEPVIAGKSLSVAHAALSGAVERLDGLLRAIAVGEDFWEHWSYSEAQALADVFDAAAQPDAARMVRERVAEADPEMWEEATTASE